jgi:hypothetical protein
MIYRKTKQDTARTARFLFIFPVVQLKHKVTFSSLHLFPPQSYEEHCTRIRLGYFFDVVGKTAYPDQLES